MDLLDKKEIVLHLSGNTNFPEDSSKKIENSLWEKIKNWSTVSPKEILFFFELLSTLISAGLPLTESLEILERQNKNPRLRKTISEIRESIKGGYSLAMALKEHPDLFDEATTSIIHAGEKSGRLNNILKELIKQLQRLDQLKKQVFGVLLYPLIVIGVMLILSVVLLVFVIPKLQVIFEGTQNLPLPTQILVKSSDIFLHHGFQIGLGIVGIFLFYSYWSKTPQGRKCLDQLWLHIPIINSLVKKMVLSRFTRLFSLLLNAGVPIIESLRLSSNIAKNYVYKEKILLASEDILQGISLSENLADNESLFPEILVNLVAVGEKTATLDQMMERAANYYDEELEREIRSLSKLLEPLILFVIAAGAIFMILAVYLPILQMNDHLL